nr:L-type lectin-domain containing receptor kinase IX.1-like [Tanacetum cinerariifolium]
GLIVGLPVVITFLGVLVLVLVLWRRKKKTREVEAEETGFDIEMDTEFEMGTGPKRFTYHELAQATGDFAENEKLGEGGFGGVYKGFLKDSNTFVAVKRVSKSSKQGIKEYASEVRIISRLRHRNLVQLIGWCHQKGELMLVYEYMENGSLDSHLFKAKSLLTWDARYKIAHGLASALLYLHEEWEQCVLHRDIKASNVMLDSNFNAKLGDFGLAKLVDHEKGSQTTMLAGTLGYMAPECVVTGKAQENQIRLLEWVWGLYGTGTLLQAVDPRLGLDFKEEEIKHLMMVGLWCAHPDSELRPSMRQVIQVLNSEASVPILPSKMPVASYLAPSIYSLSGVTSVVLNKSSSSISNTNSSNQTKSSTTSSSCSPSVSLLHSMQTSKKHGSGGLNGATTLKKDTIDMASSSNTKGPVNKNLVTLTNSFEALKENDNICKNVETQLRQLTSSPGAPSIGPSTPPNYSSGSSRNAECSNYKNLRGKINVLKATMDMHMQPKQYTVNSAALLHKVLNEMEKLDLE